MLSVVTFRKDIWRSSYWRSALVWQLFYVMGLWQSGGMVERKFADQEQGGTSGILVSACFARYKNHLEIFQIKYELEMAGEFLDEE